MDQLDIMRIFVAVAAEKSFTVAARRMGISIRQTSASVQKLEKHLGIRLLNRNTRAVSLTDVGSAYLARCTRLLDELDELESSVKDQQKQVSGHLRVTAPTAYGSLNIAPALHDFVALHPELTLDLDLTDRRVSLIEEGFDLAIRLGTLEDSALICRRLAPMRTVVCAAPSYLHKRGEPKQPAELSKHDCLINTYADEPFRWRFQRQGKPFDIRVNGRLHASAPLAVAQFAQKGLGIAQIPHYVAEDALRQGRLVALFEKFERDDSGVFVLYPQNRYLSGRVRSLIDYLAGTLIPEEK